MRPNPLSKKLRQRIVMEKIKAISPTRVDLAGGTLDLWPLFLFVDGAVTVNVAIDVYTQAELTPRTDSKIFFRSKDYQLEKEYKNLEQALADADPHVSLFRNQLNYWKPSAQGFELDTSSQSPVGGGIGGSSSLTISMMKVFKKFLNKSFRDIHHMVDVAHNIEAQVLGTPTGTQDYYPAICGSMNIIKYSHDGIHHEKVAIKDSALSENFLLVYTGKSHQSGINNFEVMKSAVSKNPHTLKALKDLKETALETEKACRSQRWDLLPSLFRSEFEVRKRLAPEFSSPEINKLAELSLSHGAQGIKICGAGGGGCVLIWCPPSQRKQVVEACQSSGFQVMSSRPVGMDLENEW